MQREINLLPRKNTSFLQREQTVTFARIAAIFSVVIVITSFIGVILLGRNYSVTDVESQQANVRSRLQLVQNKTIQQLTLLERTKKIESLLKKRISLTDKITFFQKQIPSNVTIETMTVSPLQVNISVSSTSLTALQSFLDSLTSLVTQKKVLKKLTIDNVIVSQQTGLYSVNVKGTFL